MKKRNDKGFTLVEVLVAMTILAVICAPLLQSFVLAAKTNAKAKQISQATTLAQDTIENFKAYSLEELALYFNGYDSDSSSDNFEAYITVDPSDTNYSESLVGVIKSESHLYDSSLSTTANSSIRATYDAVHIAYNGANVTSVPITDTTFVGQDSGLYCFVETNKTIGSSSFDLLIAVMADTTKSIADIKNMNSAGCAYYVQPDDQMDKVVGDYDDDHEAYYNTTHSGSAMVAVDFKSIVSRTMTIDIEKSASGEITCNVTSVYDCGSGYVASADRTQTYLQTIFNNYASSEELKSVYIYYYPLYNTAGSSARDKFVVNNSSGDEIAVYLISMGSNTTDYDYVFNENNYLVNLTVNDSNRGNSLTDFITTICSNVTTSHFSSITDNISGKSVEIKDLGNAGNAIVKYDVYIAVFKHNEDSITGDYRKTFTPDMDDYVLQISASMLDNSNVEQ